ncbi:abortive infection family protein [Desulfocurvibacter africanus]|uniref:Abortive infection protein-like C-terminal domain-containing protein n=1 Tax=Desulfocurvibacter africanus subsp. africanus str. Walvis Bay TaxID=690850 RepID=F3Z3D4_DESAF|nr:abortive infection family protein [Desulfocurvibacter africanus]EGJ51474.1 hypothetical protein Desaf_3178 [Desulfocurvibacter africanus subsp. africanus str. Walvis Bay]
MIMASKAKNKISDITRRDIFDTICLWNISWHGRMDEVDFLGRVFDLSNMPSNDPRYSNVAGDIFQHRINNDDWPDDWIFSDRRFNLLYCEDETLLRFLCEMLHPRVRRDDESIKLLKDFNKLLEKDGFRLVARQHISGRPVFSAELIIDSAPAGLIDIQKQFTDADETYVSQQITRIQAALENDPALAIGTSKELIETVCKTILHQRNAATEETNAPLPKLVRATTKALALTPDDIPETAKAAKTIKTMLSNFANLADGIAELRNLYGTGHGQKVGTKGLGIRHAKLAVGAATTLAVFLLETHRERS